MARSRRSKRTQGTVPLSLRIAEAALLVVPFVTLAYQTIRFEGFLVDKTAMLGLLAVVILGAQMAYTIDTGRVANWGWQSLRRNPLVIAVVALTITMVLSTALSLSFSRSFWGSADRSWGLFVFLAFVVIFWQARQSTDRLLSFLPVALPLIAVVAALAAILPFYGVDFGFAIDRAAGNRPPSTAGNPNWLSAWLAMVVIYMAAHTAGVLFNEERPLKPGWRGMFALYGVTLVLILWTFALTLSRGALLGMLSGLTVGVLVISVRLKWFAPVIAVGVLLVVGAAGYTAVNQYFRANPVDRNNWTRLELDLRRFARPYDDARVGFWANSLDYMTGQADPVTLADGSTDPLYRLRPIVGYGPDTLEQLSPLGEVEGVRDNQFLDRTHNLNYDTLLMHGWLGLIATVALYEAAIYLALRHLGILTQQNLWQWALFQVVGIAVGVGILSLITPELEPFVMAPLGATAGAIAAVSVWIGLGLFRKEAEEARPLSRRDMVVIAILGIVISHWVDNQFGFTQATAQPLWWILLGMLVTLTQTQPHAAPADEQPQPDIPNPWPVAGMVAGVFALYTFGIVVESRIIRVQSGNTPFLLIVMGALMVWSVLGWRLDPDHDQERGLVAAFAPMAGVWAGYLLVETFLRTSVGNTLDRTLQDQAIQSVNTLQSAFVFLSFTGVIAVFVSIASALNRRDTSGLDSTQVVVLAVLLAVGTTTYALRYSGTSLHRAANVLRNLETEDPEAQARVYNIATAAYEGAIAYMPNNSRLRLDYMDLLIRQAALTNRVAEAEAAIQQNLEEILEAEPYFTGSKEWQIYYEAYSPFIDLDTALEN